MILSSIIAKAIGCIVFVAALFVLAQAVTIRLNAGKVSHALEPFQKTNPQAKYKVLFLGDSTAVGTGASSNLYSTSGWFSQDFPDAAIDNYSRNGLRLAGLNEILSRLDGRHYDLTVMQIGCNDIIYMTPLAKIKTRAGEAVRLAKNISENVIILHCGDLGKSELFLWPLKELYRWRSMKVRDMYRANEDARVSYVDIIEMEKSVKDIQATYSADHLHLNDEGYHIWYQFIKTKLPKL